MPQHNDLATSPTPSAYVNSTVTVYYYFRKGKNSDTTKQYCYSFRSAVAPESTKIGVYTSDLLVATAVFRFPMLGKQTITASVTRSKTAPTDVPYCISKVVTIEMQRAPEPTTKNWQDGLGKNLQDWARDQNIEGQKAGERWDKMVTFFKNFSRAGRP